MLSLTEEAPQQTHQFPKKVIFVRDPTSDLQNLSISANSLS
jgi:hypothetical protein